MITTHTKCVQDSHMSSSLARFVICESVSPGVTIRLSTTASIPCATQLKIYDTAATPAACQYGIKRVLRLGRLVPQSSEFVPSA